MRVGSQSAGQQAEPTLIWILAVAPVTMKSTDEVISHLIAPLSGQAKRWGAVRYGFALGLDENNPQVQLYVIASAEVGDRLWKFAHALADQNAPHLGTVRISQPQTIPFPTPRGNICRWPWKQCCPDAAERTVSV